MDELLNRINPYVTKKYDELKSESKTYGELKAKILDFRVSNTLKRENRSVAGAYAFIADKMMEMFDKELNEKTID